MLVSVLQHDDDEDDDPEDVPTKDLLIGKSSVGILGVCENDNHNDNHNHNDDDDGVDVQFLMGDPLECKGSAQNAIAMLPPEVIVIIIIIIISSSLLSSSSSSSPSSLSSY